MKKILITLAMSVMMLPAAFAQTPSGAQENNSCPANCPRAQVCPARQNCDAPCPPDVAPCGNRPQRFRDGCPRGCFSPDSCCMQATFFDGITLTDAQKESIAALKKECAKDRKEARAAADKARDEARKTQREAARSSRSKYLSTLKEILTPEQYTQFLENAFLDSPRGGQKYRPCAGYRPGCKNMPGARMQDRKGGKGNK